MGIFNKKNWLGAALGAALALASVFTPGEAKALDTLKKGTMKLGVERLVQVGIVTGGGNTEFAMTLLPNQQSVPLQFPRVGFDYFIIDGLSIGGNLGMGVYTGGFDDFSYTIMPRVGYAFALSDKIDIWPRGGIGILGGSDSGANGLFVGECMFLWNVLDPISVEFGPTMDLLFGNGTIVGIGGNAGVAYEF